MKKNKDLYKFLKKLWNNGKSFEDKYKNFFDYYDGKLKGTYFGNEAKTSENIIEEIIETKVNATLDAPFTIQVVPSNSPIRNLEDLNDQQIIADILNAEVHNILTRNNFEELKEKIIRYGEIIGFSAIQTVFDKNEIILQYVSPENIRFDKNAKRIQDLSFVAYKKTYSPQKIKEIYCRKADGSFDLEKSKLIDKITDSLTNTKENKQTNNIIAYETNQTAGLAYNNSFGGIQAGKTVDVIEMFLIDTSVYSPCTNDKEETRRIKEESIYKYPYGRMVAFSLKEIDNEYGLILTDKPAPKGFKNLANIDFFNPLSLDNIEGKSEVEDLIPIQNRINGTLAKMAFLVSQNINTLLLPDGVVDIEDDEFINQTVLKTNKLSLDSGNIPQPIKNQMIEEATKLEAILQRYEKLAYTKAHLNETMINGARQIGTTSGEQVEQLNESPMSSIRLIQKNLKNFIIEVGKKIITLIQENYNEDRIISIATGLTVDEKNIKYAEFFTDKHNNEKSIRLYDEELEIAKEIKFKKDWKYSIEVVAGTDIPRSRRELATTMERLFSSGLLNPNTDVELLEQVLKSLDIPNYRTICQLIKQKQQAQAQTPFDIKTVLTDPNLSRNFVDIFRGLEGFSKAKGQILTILGLDTSPDTFNSAPVQTITSKSSATDIATIIPSKVSDNPEQQVEGEENAVADKLIKRSNRNVE